MNDSETRLNYSKDNQSKPNRVDYDVSRRDTDGFETNARGEKPDQGRRKSSTKKALADIDTIEMNDGGEIEMKKITDPEAHDTYIASANNRAESSSSRSLHSDAQLELDQLVSQMKAQANLRPSMPLPAKSTSKEMIFPTQDP